MAENQGCDIFIHIKNPLQMQSEQGPYTTYLIDTVANTPVFPKCTFQTRRRYSEFQELSELLASRHKLSVPKLPAKGFHWNRFESDVLENRMKGFQKFLEEICTIPQFKSDKCLHLFLQSNYTMTKIKEILKTGIMPKEISSNYRPQPYKPSTSKFQDSVSGDRANEEYDTHDNSSPHVVSMDDVSDN